MYLYYCYSLDKELFYLHDLVDEVIAHVADLHDETTRVENHVDELAEAEGDTIQLRRVLVNLVRNALQMGATSVELKNENNSIDVWKHLLENDLLFTTDVMQINKMVGDGPFTPGMPPESPGGVGNWLGLEMVSAFMEANDEVTLNQLMSMKNDREILKYYKP